MIIFIYGTTAEAIKLAPVIRRLEKRGIQFEQWLTYQHTTTLTNIMPALGLPKPDRIIAKGNRKGAPLRNYRDVFAWLRQILRWTLKNTGPLRRSISNSSVVVVHGDTMTSVVGAFVARRLRLPSAHVEAGLRSGNWRHPFPEELDRRIVGALATIHYAPSEEAKRNLGSRPNIIMTGGNTVIDSVLDQAGKSGEAVAPYGVVLLHRFEFISNPDLVEQTLRSLSSGSPVRLRLLVDAYSKSTLEAVLTSQEPHQFEIEAKLSHEDFISVVRGAEFVVTDSGGVQEETALLGIPTLIHRKATERAEGLGRNAILSEWENENIAQFLADYKKYRQLESVPVGSPSDIVVDDLVARGFAS